MMTAINADNTGVQEFEVRDAIGPLKFRGIKLVDLSWTYSEAVERRHERWTDITLYDVREEHADLEYIVTSVARSRVYHRPDGPCGRGVSKLVGDLRKDQEHYDALVPCRESGCCPDSLDAFFDLETVPVEVDRPHLSKCVDAYEAIEVLQNQGGGARRGPAQLSSLSARVLQEACQIDKNIEDAMLNTRRL